MTALSLLAALLLAAEPAKPPIPRSEITIPRLSGAISLDGRLDEEQWKSAAVIDSLTNQRPIEDTVPSEETRILVYRDETHLYVGFESFDAEPAKVRATFGDRDTVFGDDWVGVLLDPFNDGRHAALLVSNPLGVQIDCIESENSDDDCSWDTIFSTAGRLTGRGFVVEMSIPFSSLRVDPEREAWGFQPGRMIARTGEQSLWSPFRQANGSFLQQMGIMHGMKGIEAPPLLELIPELTARTGPGIDYSDALYHSGRTEGLSRGASAGDLGLTAKLSRGGIAGAGTINPDFSQVESDTSRVTINQRFPLSYGEKRPFFLEGREQLVLPWTVIYTRAIVDPLYGVKVNGKEGPTAFAFLTAMDQHPADSTVDPAWIRDNFNKQPAFTTLARVTTDVSEDATLGIVATDKRVNGAANHLSGPDVTLHLTRTWTVVSQGLWSSTDELDDTHLEGNAFKVRLIHNDRHWNWFSWYEETDKDFRAEAGFIPRVGYQETGEDTSYRIETGREHGLVFVRPGLSTRALNSTANDDRNRDFDPYLGINFGHSFVRPGFQYYEERFGSVPFRKRRLTLDASSSYFKWVDTSVSLTAGEEIAYFEPTAPYLGSSATADFSASLKPMERIGIGTTYYREIFSRSRSLAPKHFNDEGVYDASVARTTVQVFFTQYVSARVIAQWTTIDWKLSLSGLLAYRPGPGTIFYIGYQDAAAPGTRGVDTRNDRALFVKLSYLWRS